MEPDEEGFLYPHINKFLCIECGLCKNVCAFQNGYDVSDNLGVPIVYAVKHNDLETRMNSQSGGLFTAISDYILDKEGIIYGAGYKDHFTVCHKRATSKKERNEFRGSKYVQSEMNDIYLKVKEDLQGDKWVLFSGTPCQTAGLRSFLAYRYEKLIVCDIICHGTPSPKVWNDFILYMENKHKGIISTVNFRNKKRFGWASHRETIEINGQEFDSDIYAQLFYRHNILRPACFNCKYTNLNRPSDVTMADFWHIDEAIQNFNDNKGVSLCLINTAKAKEVFEEIKEDLDFRVFYTNQVYIQPNLKHPTKLPSKRGKYWNKYRAKGFSYLYKEQVKRSLRKIRKNRVREILKRFGLLR